MTTEGACLVALQRATEKLGESPTKAQYEALGLQPASATIIRTIGGWNKAKKKANLETSYSQGSRVASKPDTVELPPGTSWEELSVDQRWHYRNVDWNAERTAERRSRLRSWLTELKCERGCSQCGVDTPGCLDLHHVDETTKRMAVGRMVTFGYRKDALCEEIEKCVVLCANCHRTVHHTPPTDERRRWVLERKAEEGCGKCGESNPARLDFHHTGEEKEATVAALLSDGHSKARIVDEIERCSVLYANCHRLEHYVESTR